MVAIYRTTFISGCCVFLVLSAFAQSSSNPTYTVQTGKVIAAVPSTLWGVFFEDINRGADGGVYAELVENRSFDFPKPMTGWETWPRRVRDGIFEVTDHLGENSHDPKFMHIETRPADTVGLINGGFDGIALKTGVNYVFTLRYRQIAPGIHMRVFLFNGRNRPVAQGEMVLRATGGGQAANSTGAGGEWQEQQTVLAPTDTASGGKLLVVFEGAGRLDIDRISLFPADTWKGRSGGWRNDLVQRLADLHPGFLRFPGGCVVEGNQLVHRYQWKNTIGPLQDRLPVQSIWADDVPDRQTPDYMESFGLGFLEYFELCEDIGAAPPPIINCGMSCQFDAAEVVPLSQLRPFIQDALDLIEFANGDSTSGWGAKRAAYGHPAPFHMTMLGVGNENWGPQYAERLALFTSAIKAKYPNIKIVGATGYSRNIPVFTYMDSVLRARHADIIDEHFYETPKWFLGNTTRYDGYDRSGPRIFVGEYAAQSDRIGSLKNVNNLLTALAEAAFMTGIERNADVVSMASYAPLFAHVTGWQWTPDLIWFDNRSSYVTPNYYVQQLFAMNKGTAVVPLLKDGRPVTGQDSCWVSAVVDESRRELIVKCANVSAQSRTPEVHLLDAVSAGSLTVTTLSNADPGVVNSLARPEAIAPVTRTIAAKGKRLLWEAPPYSLTVVRMPFRGTR